MSTPPWGEEPDEQSTGRPADPPGGAEPSSPYPPYGEELPRHWGEEPSPYPYGPHPYDPNHLPSPHPVSPYATPPRTNPMAIASMVTSIVGAVLLACCLGGIVGLVGAILGHVARKQIQDRGETGAGFARAGIVVGWIAFGLMMAYFVLIGIAAVVDSTS